jgi:hypothetical protein
MTYPSESFFFFPSFFTRHTTAHCPLSSEVVAKEALRREREREERKREESQQHA